MEMLVIEGKSRLQGEVIISGSKNAALPIMIATLLCNKDCEIENIPHLSDTKFLVDLIRSFGAKCSLENNKFQICPNEINKSIAHYDVVRKMRASVLVLAPLLARLGHAQVSLPGGCTIGARPVDIHLNALSLMKAQIEVKDGYINAKLPHKKFFGTKIDLPLPSVGATEQIIMAAVLAEGTTTINNAAKEPEIFDLCQALNSAGAKIEGYGTSHITIKGVNDLNGIKYINSPDRIEAGTFIAIACATQSSLVLKVIKPEEIKSVCDLFLKCGLQFIIKDEVGSNLKSLFIKANSRPRAMDMETQVYPGFPTDLQAQFMASMTISDGISHIYERIFENRMMHVPELLRMGANISLNNGKAVVKGVENLNGAQVMASDIRASAGLVIAALCAKGKSEIRRIYHLDRGYEKIDEKLLSLGAKVKRIEQP